MFERLTDRARQVVILAQEEARKLESPVVGTEHLLLGMLGEGEGVAAVVLRKFDLDLDAMRTEVEEFLAGGGHGGEFHRPFSDRCKKVLELSLREALQLGCNYIGTEHILLGVIREGEGRAAQVLIKQGLDLAEVRHSVIDTLAGYATPTRRESIRLEFSAAAGDALMEWIKNFESFAGPLDHAHPLRMLYKALATKKPPAIEMQDADDDARD